MNCLTNFDVGDIQLTVREWDCENWKVSEPIDIHLKKKSNCHDLMIILNNFYPNIKVEIYKYSII